jgi:hypothetical protein
LAAGRAPRRSTPQGVCCTGCVIIKARERPTTNATHTHTRPPPPHQPHRAKNIKNQAVVNEDADQRTLLRKYERELRKLRAELTRRNKELVDKRHLLEVCVCVGGAL